MKHTPGPWEVYNGGDYRHIYGGKFDNSSDPLAEVHSSQANADLIAAAPEQNAVLEWIADEIILAMGHAREPKWSIIQNKVDAVLTKAKGETP